MMKSCLLAGVASVAAFSSTPGGVSLDPDVTVTAESQNCDGSMCFNRLHPTIPMAAWANPGEVVLFDTPTSTADIKDKALLEENLAFSPSVEYIGTLHQLAGPLGVYGAMAGDKIAITILDIEAENWGWNHAAPGLGYLSDMVKEEFFNWWKPNGPDSGRPDYWTSDRFPDVQIPFHPFPGIVTVLPNMEIIERVKAREIAVSSAGGTAAVAGGLQMGVTGTIPSAFPSAICGVGGSDPENCLRTVAPDVYYGNQDSQRLAVGSTLVLECFVDGCGIGIGDVHGAQGDGEVSITAIEIEAKVKVSIKLIKPDDPMHVLPSPTTVGTTSVKDYSPTAFVSFHGFGDKHLPIPAFIEEANTPWPIQQHLTFGEAVADMDFVADNLQVSGRNALLKCITFLHDVLGYSFSQVVDKPQASMEAILPVNYFTGESRAKINAAVGL